MLKDLNFCEYYKDADGNTYKLVASASGAHGVQVIYAKVDVTVGDLLYCTVDEFEKTFHPTTRFI